MYPRQISTSEEKQKQLFRINFLRSAPVVFIRLQNQVLNEDILNVLEYAISDNTAFNTDEEGDSDIFIFIIQRKKSVHLFANKVEFVFFFNF